MPTELFSKLHKEKKDKIINVAINEFSQKGFQNGSTNQICKNANISKGSLFKYFLTKEDLYLYLMDNVAKEFTIYINSNISKLPNDLFDRIIEYSKMEFSWYVINEEKYKLLLMLRNENSSPGILAFRKQLEEKSYNIFYSLFENINATNIDFDLFIATDLILWLLNGFNERFISANTDSVSSISIELLKDKYVRELSTYINVLKKGLAKKIERDN